MLRMAAGEEMRKGTGKGGEVLGGLSWNMAVECKATAEGFERSAEVSAQRPTLMSKFGAGSEEKVTERSRRSHFASRFILRGRSPERKRRAFGPKGTKEVRFLGLPSVEPKTVANLRV